MNCAALSPALLESELFGHEKGAFTGATDRKLGKFEAADGGTLLLDEIGEMILDIQAKFLRVLEGHPFERVGGNRPIRTDVRVIAATNRDLEQAVREGNFREDLYYRLHVVELRLPPLRERGEDVIELARAFLQRFSAQVGRRVEGISPLAEAKLRSHTWPGNIRELRNVIERAVVLGASPWIEVEDLVIPQVRAIDHKVGGARSEVPSSSEKEGTSEAGLPSIAELEWMHIQKVLMATGGNKSRAAAILGIERSTLDRKLKRQ
jgi:Nif-specific regulatory protein